MRTNWSLKVKNFGRILEAEIEISPMILFVGDNNSGKSYLMTLLWGIMEEDYYRHITVEVRNLPFYKEAEKLIFDEISSNSNNGVITNEGKRKLVEWFSEFFNLSKEKIVGDIFNNPVEMEEVEFLLLDQERFALSQQKLKRWRKEIPSIEEEKKRFLSYCVLDCAIQVLFSDLMGDTSQPLRPLFLPASRTGFMLTYKTLINESIRSHFGTTRKQGSVFTKPIIRFLNRIIGLSEEINQEYQDIISFIEQNMIYGTVVKDNSPIKNICFASEGMNVPIPLYLTSSLVTEISSILLFLQDKNSRFKTLIIEEPEEHLHLKAQSMMARILTMILNKNRNVWITTHSDTFFQQMNNLMKLNAHPRRTELMEKFGMKDDELLSYKLVKVYQFDIVGGKTVVSKVEGSQTGFPAVTFNHVIDELVNQVIELEED